MMIYGFDDCPWNFAEDWLEPYEGLKEGDLAIFWDNESTTPQFAFLDI